MPNRIDTFNNGEKMYDIRTVQLNPTIERVNKLEPAVEGLQTVVALTMSEPQVVADRNSIDYKNPMTGQVKSLDLTEMFEQYPHGVDVTDDKGHFFSQAHRLNFNGGVSVRQTNAEIYVDVTDVKATIGSQTESLKSVQLTGDVGTSSLHNGILTIDLDSAGGGAGGSISGQIEDGTPINISKVQVTGNVGSSALGGDTLKIELPTSDPMQGKLSTGDVPTPINTIALKGNRGSSLITGGEMQIEIPYNSGQIGTSGAAKDFHKLVVAGNTGGSSIDNDVMTIKVPNSISVKAEGSSAPVITDVSGFVFANSTVAVQVHESNPRVLVTPNGMMGQVKSGTPPAPVKSILVSGDTGGSTINSDGQLNIDLPFLKGNVDGTTNKHNLTDIKIIGNKGRTAIDDGVLTIDLPTGGGGGSGGSIAGTVKKSTGDVTGDVTSIEITGDADSSDLAGGVLKIELPHASGLAVKDVDGDKLYTAVTNLEFQNTQVTFDSGKNSALLMTKPLQVSWKEGADAAPIKEIDFRGYSTGNEVDGGKVTINIPDPKAKVGTSEGELKQVVVTGELGGSGYHDGTLTIELPSGGGGGTGGGDISGIVGSETAKINRVQVIGNVTGSTVDAASKTLAINVPDKPAFTDGVKTEGGVDVVQVAHSTLEVKEQGGKKLALITPVVNQFFQGWFGSMADLDTQVPAEQRILTKTCAYVQDVNSTGIVQNHLFMWMPDLTGTGKLPAWTEVFLDSSLQIREGVNVTGRILSVMKNDMVTINNNTGELTIKDVTIPEVNCDVMNHDGTGSIIKGKFKNLHFVDGSGTADLDTTLQDLKIYRAQRRVRWDGTDDPDTLFGDEKYQGSIFFNTADKCWWGYSDTNPVSGEKKWTRVAHEDMSVEVADLVKRLPDYMTQVVTVDGTGDSPAWQYSGWTGVPQTAQAGILPPWAQGSQGMVIQTFKGPSGSGTVGAEGRIQIGYMGADATMYKRWRDETEAKWSSWARMSFNEGDETRHNRDPEAHKYTNPFYQVFGFGAKYPDLAATAKGPFKYIIEHERESGLIASSGGAYNDDDTGVRIPYDADYHIRGLAYIGGKSDIVNKSMRGSWVVELQKCEVGSLLFNRVSSQTYIHASTSLKYPPFSFNFYKIPLKQGEFIRLKIQFQPETETETKFLNDFPDLWIMPGRSYFAVDVEGQDIGYCIGKNMCRFHGGFSQLGGGAFGMPDGAWPADKGIIVGDGIETAVAAG